MTESGIRLRLFCLPYAGGAARIFRGWSKALPDFVDVVPLELPGRGTRMNEPLCTSMAAVICDLLPSVLAYRDTAIALFGHSLGALTAFELARGLRRHLNLEPAALFVSGYRAPHLPRRATPVHTLSDAQLLERLRTLGGTPKEVLQDRQLMTLMLPILRADFAVVETHTYTPEPPFTCPLIALGGLQDGEVSPAELAEWRRYTSGPFTLRIFPGNHFYIHTHERLLVEAIKEELERIPISGLSPATRGPETTQ